MREQFHTEWERAVKNKMMWIAVFIGCLLAIAQTVFEVYPYARNPLMFYRGSDGQPASLFMYWFGLNSGSPYKVTFLTIFPVLAMMPHALSYHLDRKGGYIKNVYTRTKKINYLTAKYLAVFLSGGLTVLFPYLVSLPVTACMLPALTPIRNRTVSFGNRAVFIDILYQTVCLHRHLHGDYIFLRRNFCDNGFGGGKHCR